MPGCQLKGDFPLTDNLFCLPVSLKTALFFRVRFCIYLWQTGCYFTCVPCHLLSCLYRASQAKLTAIKVIQWLLVLQALPLDSHFLSYILQTVVSVSSAAAPESSCCPGGRGDFLLWGSSRTSAGCQTQLGELLACTLSLSVHFSPLCELVYLPAR